MDDQGYFHSFPAVQGFQGGRPFFIAMCPLRMIPKLFMFDEEEVPAELRAQRSLNKNRVPAIAQYLVANPDSYILSALTASVDGQVRFAALDAERNASIGVLEIPMDARILINDGQHRRAAIEEALRDSPALGQDNVPVLFFGDDGLVRSQQMFADLNKYAVRPSYSLSTLYDHRDPSSELARYLAAESRAFRGLTEMEKSTISNRSVKLFTLSSIKHASRALLRKHPKDEFTAAEKMIAKEYWDVVSDQIPDWQRARTKDVATSQLRQEYVHAHGVALQALALAGAELLSRRPKQWKADLRQLRKIDWSRSNIAIWEGRAMAHGRISKAATNVHLAANYVKSHLDMPLSPGDLELEALLPAKKRLNTTK